MTPDFPPVSHQTNASLGQRLQAARIAKNLSIEDVCSRLKLSAEIVTAMEADDHARLGAAVFARGRLGNYARLVGVPMLAVDTVFARLTRELPALVTARSISPLERPMQRFARQGVYIVLTAVIFVVPLVWIANGNRLPNARASLTALDGPVDAGNTARTSALSVPDQRNEQTVVASMAPFPGYRSAAPEALAQSMPLTAAAAQVNPVGAVAADRGLHLHFNADSWVEVVARDGHSLAQGMIVAGSDLRYPQGRAAQVTIANADAVQVMQDGQAIDLQAFRRANVVRFTLSSDGSPAPAGD